MYARRNAIHDICDHLSHWFHSPICTGGELEERRGVTRSMAPDADSRGSAGNDG
jgi:hypothetical protein